MGTQINCCPLKGLYVPLRDPNGSITSWRPFRSYPSSLLLISPFSPSLFFGSFFSPIFCFFLFPCNLCIRCFRSFSQPTTCLFRFRFLYFLLSASLFLGISTHKKLLPLVSLEFLCFVLVFSCFVVTLMTHFLFPEPRHSVSKNEYIFSSTICFVIIAPICSRFE